MRTTPRPLVGPAETHRAMPWLALLAAVVALVLATGSAAAAEEASIAHAETSGGELRVLVDVPAGADVDLAGVTATLDGTSLEATAAPAGTGAVVERTAVLVMDVSNSMRRQGRFAASQQAARAYLRAVPEDVAVGIVTFHGDVTTALEPTTDHDAARAVIDGLTLGPQTLLYDGLLTAIEVAGSSGQRSLLVLSDGADTGDETTLEDVTTAVGASNALVDVVSLGQSGPRLERLDEIATAGNGQVLEADGGSLARTFQAEAEVLADQVLVTAPLPDGFDATDATIEVTLPTAADELVARALVPIQEAAEGSDPDALTAPTNVTGWDTPGWLLPVGIGVLAVGALAMAWTLVPGRKQPMTIAERVSAYVGREGTGAPPPPSAAEPLLGQAKTAAADLLHRNQRIESNLAGRLGSAGSGFRPSEWLMLHIGVVLAAGIIGLLVGRASVLLVLLFLLVGAALPPLWLRWQAGRRRKAFNNSLPETLQLMSGALSAGLSLAQAVDTIVKEGPEPIAGEFKRVLIENRVGLPLEDGFDGVAARFDSEDFAWVVMAIRIQRQVGGNLAELLTTVADTMRERQYLRRQVATLAAEGKLSAIILCALPPVFVVFILLTQPDYLAPMFEQLLGWVMLGAGALWLALGMFWMSRLVKVEI